MATVTLLVTLGVFVLWASSAHALYVPYSENCPPVSTYDFIVVGAGSAGSAIAARLSDRYHVLLLEAGDAPPDFANIPFYSSKLVFTDYDWKFKTEPQQFCCGMSPHNMTAIPQGKALGGSSAINGMAFTRGNRLDYDTWEKLGNPGWGYKDVLHYFMKLEDFQIPHNRYDAPYHGRGGPITLSPPNFKTPMADAFLQGGMELGYPVTDVNGEFQYGFTFPPSNLKDGQRWGNYQGYIEPILQRHNLHIVVKAFVTKILINSNQRATGVMYERSPGKNWCIAKAKREVIISAGAINSPKLLMLSGIGPKEVLGNFGIPIVQELPGVGVGLMDHVIFVRSVFNVKQPVTLNPKIYDTPENIQLWHTNRTGPMSSSQRSEGIAFLNSSLATADHPDLEILFFSGNFFKLFSKGLNESLLESNQNSLEDDQGCFVILLQRPKSVGYVTLRSANAHTNPIINPNYLQHPDDVQAIIEGIQFTEKLVRTKAFQKYGAELVDFGQIPSCRHLEEGTHPFYECVVRVYSRAGLHLGRTCKMGPNTDAWAVVDNELRVYGIKGLRVADASIMPTIPNGHTNAACIMIGEKAADMILKAHEGF